MNFATSPEEILRAAGGSREHFGQEHDFAPGWDRNPEADFADRPQRGQREAAPPETLAVIDPTTLQALPIPERRWIVHDWLGCGFATALYGNGGVGKTLLAQTLMTSAAIGRPWLGQITRPCRSLGLFCEDDAAELHRRQERINTAAGCDFSDLESMRWISGAGHDNAFVGFDQRGNMQIFPRFYEIQRAAKTHGAELVVLDNAADLFAGNENDRGQVRRFINLLAGLALDLGAACLLLAHPSRTGLASGALDGGSTAWHNSVRSRWTLAPEAEAEDGGVPGGLVLARPKSNYAARADATIRLQWSDRGTLEPAARAGASTASGPRPDAEAVFLHLLDRTWAARIPLSESPNAGTFAPKVFAKRPDREGYGRREFDAAMHGLFAENVLTVISYKDESGRPRRRLARAPAEGAAEEGQQ